MSDERLSSVPAELAHGERRRAVVREEHGADIIPLVCRVAIDADERAAYFALRRAIFCDEQRLFPGDDRDQVDDRAFPLVCYAMNVTAGRLAGVVRIWQEQPGAWWGGRLGVASEFRRLAAVGRRLVQTAVGTARAWGAVQFRAMVQRANVPFFRRLHWQSLDETTVFGKPHHLMQADLRAYPIVDTGLPAGGAPKSSGGGASGNAHRAAPLAACCARADVARDRAAVRPISWSEDEEHAV